VNSRERSFPRDTGLVGQGLHPGQGWGMRGMRASGRDSVGAGGRRQHRGAAGSGPRATMFAFMRRKAKDDAASGPKGFSKATPGCCFRGADRTCPAAVTPPLHRVIEPRIGSLLFHVSSRPRKDRTVRSEPPRLALPCQDSEQAASCSFPRHPQSVGPRLERLLQPGAQAHKP